MLSTNQKQSSGTHDSETLDGVCGGCLVLALAIIAFVSLVLAEIGEFIWEYTERFFS